MRIVLQRFIFQEGPETLFREPHERKAEEEELIFHLVPLLFRALEKGFVQIILRVFGEEQAGVKERLQSFLLNGFIFFQSLI